MSDTKRGGARKGAGRKPLPEGMRRVSRSINLPEAMWEWIDEERKQLSRSDWLLRRLSTQQGALYTPSETP